mmetsp:Transcript_14693/g.38962  ORF Transcript_14693/g.38962 Transcript_14693/m.38962 type:complete len:392 (+) Transcript_14693:123-1298(+)
MRLLRRSNSLQLCVCIRDLLRQCFLPLIQLGLLLRQLLGLFGQVGRLLSSLLLCEACSLGCLFVTLCKLLLLGDHLCAPGLELILQRLQLDALVGNSLLRCQQLLHLLGMGLLGCSSSLELCICLSDLLCKRCFSLFHLSLLLGQLLALPGCLCGLLGHGCRLLCSILVTLGHLLLLGSQLSALACELLLLRLQAPLLSSHCLLRSQQFFHLLGMGLLGGRRSLELRLCLSNLLGKGRLLLSQLSFLLVQLLGPLDILMDLLGSASHLLAGLLLACSHFPLLRRQLCLPLFHVLLQFLKAVVLLCNGCLRILQLLGLLGMARLDGSSRLELCLSISHALRQRCLLLLHLCLPCIKFTAPARNLCELLGSCGSIFAGCLVTLGQLLLLGNHL